MVVFKYPQTANENYIKRCIGLPNETIVIYGGNIYTRTMPTGKGAIKRNPPDKVRAIMQTVYDNDYTVADLAAAGLSLRWNAMEPADTGSWQPLDGLWATAPMDRAQASPGSVTSIVCPATWIGPSMRRASGSSTRGPDSAPPHQRFLRLQRRLAPQLRPCPMASLKDCTGWRFDPGMRFDLRTRWGWQRCAGHSSPGARRADVRLPD